MAETAIFSAYAIAESRCVCYDVRREMLSPVPDVYC